MNHVLSLCSPGALLTESFAERLNQEQLIAFKVLSDIIKTS